MAYYRELVAVCGKALSDFDPSTAGVEDYLERFLNSTDCEVLEGEREQVFLREVVAGCVQHRQLIKVVVDGYYCSAEGCSCLRADTHLYNVVSYILLFRLREIGMTAWRRLIQSQNTGKMHKFLSFTLRDDNLKGWITAEWYKVYDQQFVDTSILSPLMRHYDDLLAHVDKMAEQLANKSQPKPPSKTHTEPVPFNLTKPHPRSIPSPDKVPALKPHRPVPQSTYTPPVEQARLAEAFRTNKMKAQATLKEARRRQFACANAEKSDKTKAKMEEIVNEREAELHSKPRRPGPVPLSTQDGPSVKLNTAAVLREGARVHQEQLQQEKRLADLEAGEKDATEFTRWQEEMNQREAAERLAEVERKHLQAQLSYEEAIIARECHMRNIQHKAKAVKEESESLMQAYFAQREEQHKELRRLVEMTIASHHNTKEARLQLQAMKRSIVQEVSAESQALMARALEEAEQEMRCKAELIQQIRAMERAPLIRTKFVDLTETGKQGLLVEMSVAELRERLSLMKVAEAEEEDRRRKEIAAGKQAKEKLLSETKESISRHRKEQSRHTSNKQEWEEAVLSKHHSTLREKQISQLQEKLQARRKERERLQSESQVKPGRQGEASKRRGSRVSSPSQPITSTLLQATRQTAVN